MRKPSKKTVVAEYAKTHNILKTAHALGMEWHEVKSVLDEEKIDLYYRGAGVRKRAA